MSDTLNRRSFLQYGASAVTIGLTQGVQSVVPPLRNVERELGGEDDLEELTIAQLQDAMRSGARTAQAICAAYLARIAALDSKLYAVLETNPEALRIAGSLDAERKAGKVRGPLHGIPVLVKDNITTGDRMMTTAGSLALAGSTLLLVIIAESTMLRAACWPPHCPPAAPGPPATKPPSPPPRPTSQTSSDPTPPTGTPSTGSTSPTPSTTP